MMLIKMEKTELKKTNLKIIDPKAVRLFKGSYDGGCCGPEFAWYKINEKLHQIRYSAGLGYTESEFDSGYDIQEQDKILVPIIQDVLGDMVITSVHKTSSENYDILQINSIITDAQLTMIKEKKLKTNWFCIDS